MHASRRRLTAVALVMTLVLGLAGCGTRLGRTEIASQRRGLFAGDAAGGNGATGSALGDNTADPSNGGAGSSGGQAAGDLGVGTAGGATAGGASAGQGTGTGAGAGAGQTGTGPGQAAGGGPGGGPARTASDVGVTPTTITLGNISTLTGPVPGLFKGAVVGTQAFLAYQNSLGGVAGRTLKLTVADDGLDSGTNRAAALDLVGKVFAFAGSFSTSDDGSADVLAKNPGVPDVGYALSRARNALPNNYSPQPLVQGWRAGPFRYLKEKYPDAVTKVALFYTDVQVSRDAAHNVETVAAQQGWKIVYRRATQANEANFTADVLQMRNAGVRGLVSLNDPSTQARVATAMAQQNLKLDFSDWGATAYDPKFTTQAGDASNGTMMDIQTAMYGGEDSATVPEVALMRSWAVKVSPGVVADTYLALGWASARLLVQGLLAAGPNLTRPSTIAAMKGIDEFDSNGLVPPVGPASKRPATCFLLIGVDKGAFRRVEPAGKGFACGYGPFVAVTG